MSIGSTMNKEQMEKLAGGETIAMKCHLAVTSIRQPNTDQYLNADIHIHLMAFKDKKFGVYVLIPGFFMTERLFSVEHKAKRLFERLCDEKTAIGVVHLAVNNDPLVMTIASFERSSLFAGDQLDELVIKEETDVTPVTIPLGDLITLIKMATPQYHAIVQSIKEQANGENQTAA